MASNGSAAWPSPERAGAAAACMNDASALSVSPLISVISAGEDNPYGHPHAELIQRLEESGTRLLRTDRDGAVRVLTDGHSLWVNCFVACPETVAPSQSAPAPDHRQEN